MLSTPNNIPKTRPIRRLVTAFVLIGWVVACFLLIANFQNIEDWQKLRDYQAPEAISQLATQDTMTDYGRHLFYLNKPSVDDRERFTKECPNNGGEQTIILGCYKGNQSGIFLLQVTDPRLDGVIEVTAAHEMLHAGYQRLGASERKKVDAMLVDYYDHQLTDERVKKVIEAYKKSEPNDVVNEMHSVFGSEITSLPAPLETYYSRYFSNRQQVTGFAGQYQGEFTSRQAIVANDDVQLVSLKSQINTAEDDLQAQQVEINDQQTSLIRQRNSDVAAYNAAVPVFNQLVDDYNAEVSRVQGLVNQYNQLVAARNAVAQEVDQLTKSLSASNEPISNN